MARDLHTLVGEGRYNDLGATLVPCPWRDRKVTWGRVARLILVVVCVLCGCAVVWLCVVLCVNFVLC